MRTLIRLKGGFSIEGAEAVDAIREIDEMYAIQEFPNEWSCFIYDSEDKVPLNFIKAVSNCVDTVTVYASRDLIIDSIKQNGWIKELEDLEFLNNMDIESLLPEEERDGKQKSNKFKVEICMPKSQHNNNYYSINGIKSLYDFEDRLSYVTGETNIDKIERLGEKLDKQDPLTAQEIRECGLQTYAINDDISVFRMEGFRPFRGSRICVFDRKNENFHNVIESDLDFDLKAQDVPGDKISISNTNHSVICENPNSEVYKKFSEVCDFLPMANILTVQNQGKTKI